MPASQGRPDCTTTRAQATRRTRAERTRTRAGVLPEFQLHPSARDREPAARESLPRRGVKSRAAPEVPRCCSLSIREKLPLIRSLESERAEESQDSHHQHPRVNAHVSGLQTRSYPTEKVCNRGTSVHEQAIDEAVIDHTPEKGSRDDIGGRHNCSINSFVHVILVGDNSLEAMLWYGVALLYQLVGPEPHESEHDAEHGDQDCTADQQLLRCRGDSSSASSHARGRCPYHRLEPVREKLARTKRNDVSYHLGQVQPASEQSQNPEDDERASHHPRCFVQVL